MGLNILFMFTQIYANLCKLFKMIVAYRYVPNGFFYKGTIVLVVKDNSRILNDMDNYI